jgi:predicted DNA-binding transcriptional regulator YafY
MICRVLNILQKASSPKGCPSTQFLAAEFETSARTIKNDLSFIRNQLHCRIRWDEALQVYFLENCPFPIASLSLSDTDTHLLFASRALVEAAQPELLEAYDEFLEKLEVAFPSQVFQRIQKIESVSALTQHGSHRASMETLTMVSQALRNHAHLEIHYRKNPRQQAEVRNLIPGRIILHRNTFYLRAYDLEARDYRNFALPRVESVRIKKPRPGAESAPADPSSGSGFGLFSSSESTRVSLRFSGWAAAYVGERIWAEDQESQWLDEQTLVLSFTTCDYRELVAWLLGYAECAEVLAPDSLRQALLEKLKLMQGLYA